MKMTNNRRAWYKHGIICHQQGYFWTPLNMETAMPNLRFLCHFSKDSNKRQVEGP